MRFFAHTLLAVVLLLGPAAAFAARDTTEVRAWERAEGKPGTVTVTTRVSVEGFRDPAILIGGLVEPFEISVDGEVLQASRGALGAHGGWHWVLLPLPLGPGERTVRVTTAEGASDFFRRPGTAFVGEHGSVVVSALGEQLPLLAVTVIACVVGLVSLLVFLRRREQCPYMSYGIFALATGLAFCARASVHSVLWEEAPAVWEHLRLAARAVAPAHLVAFFAFAGPQPNQRLIRATYWVGSLGLVLVLLDVALDGVLHATAVWTLNVGFLAGLAITFVLIGQRLRTEPRRYLPSAVALTLVLAASLLEAGRVSFADTALIFGLLFLLGAMGDLVLRRFTAVFAALQEEVRARDEFLSVVAHELRNPLAAVKAGVDLLSAQVSRPDHKKHLEMVNRQARHLARLMDDLVDLGRIRAGRLKVEPQPLLASTVVASALETMRHVAEAKGVALRAEPPEEALGVEADPVRLEQMITNLLRNAIQHTAAGGTVTLAVEPSAAQVRFRIRDTGRGMTAEMLASLFGPDADAAPRLSRGDSEGMGVGLALVRKLAALHGGALCGTSGGVNQGSELTLELRRTDPPHAAAVRARAPAPQRPAPTLELEMPSPPEPVAPSTAGELLAGAATTADAPELAARRILLIDDNANLRLSMRLLLEHSGFCVQEAGDGRVGLEQLMSGAYDAAVVDLRMPEVDGIEVARRLRAHPLGQRIRLVALTGFGQPEEQQRARAAGFDDVLVKPANPDQLARALR